MVYGGTRVETRLFFNIKKAKSPYPPSFISFLLPFPLRLTLSASFYLPFFLCLYPAPYFSIFYLSIFSSGAWGAMDTVRFPYDVEETREDGPIFLKKEGAFLRVTMPKSAIGKDRGRDR